MSCEIANFEPTSCSVTTVNLCDVENTEYYSIKLTHTGNNKSYWFEAPFAATIQLVITDFDIDVNVPYEFEIFDLQSTLNTPISFAPFGSTDYTYEKGQFSFYGSKSEGTTLPTFSILQLQ